MSSSVVSPSTRGSSSKGDSTLPQPSPALLRSSTELWRDSLKTARQALRESHSTRVEQIIGVKRELQDIIDELTAGNDRISTTFQALAQMVDAEKAKLSEMKGKSRVFPSTPDGYDSGMISDSAADDAFEPSVVIKEDFESFVHQPSSTVDVDRILAEFDLNPPEIPEFEKPDLPELLPPLDFEIFERTPFVDTSLMSPTTLEKHGRLLTAEELLAGDTAEDFAARILDGDDEKAGTTQNEMDDLPDSSTSDLLSSARLEKSGGHRSADSAFREAVDSGKSPSPPLLGVPHHETAATAIVLPDENLDAVDEDDDYLLTEEEKAMLEEETPAKLMKMKNDDLPKDVRAIVGDLKKLKSGLPKKKHQKKCLERDLRKMRLCIKDSTADERKYLKLAVMKNLERLYETFQRYCIIGGDHDWLTVEGWEMMVSDACIPAKSGPHTITSKKCKKIFYSVFGGHHNPSAVKGSLSLRPQRSESLSRHAASTPSLSIPRGGHAPKTDTMAFGGFLSKITAASWSDDDPWTGHWSVSVEHPEEVYHLKQVGDRKVIGFIKNMQFCNISGALGLIDHSKAKFTVRWLEGPRVGQIRSMTSVLHPPESDGDTVRMEIKWEAISEDAAGITKDVLTLYKIGPAEDSEFGEYSVGLARHEFFDALVTMSMHKYGADMRKHKALDLILNEQINPFIWDSIEVIEKSKKKRMFAKYKTELHKLFVSYASADTDRGESDDRMGIDEYLLLVYDIFEQGRSQFRKGGKPNEKQIRGVFQLTLRNNKYDLELSYPLFQSSLEILAMTIFRKKSRMKYEIPPIEDRLSYILQWCVKVQKNSKPPDLAKLKRQKTKSIPVSAT